MNKNSKDLRACTVFLDKNGFCVIALKPLDADIVTAKDAEEACHAAYVLCNNKKTPLLFDMTQFNGQIAPGVRAIFRNDPELNQIKYYSAIAINSLGNRIIVNFYIKFNKPATPLKIFSDKEKATQWLLKISKNKSELV